MNLRFPVLAFIFGILIASFSIAATSTSNILDVSIGRVTVNSAVVIESRNNLVIDYNSQLGQESFIVSAEVLFNRPAKDARIEASITGKRTGMTVSDSTVTFTYNTGDRDLKFFNIILSEGLKSETEFDLTIKVIDVNGNIKSKKFSLITKERTSSPTTPKPTDPPKPSDPQKPDPKPTITRDRFDVSIDRVSVNSQVVIPNRNNLVLEANRFNVAVAFTSLENSQNVHVEASLRDLRSGNSIGDSTFTFDIIDGVDYQTFLQLNLLDPMDESDAFELTVKIIDEQGRLEQKTYSLKTDENGGINSGRFDVSIDRVLLNGKAIAASNSNFIDETDEFNVVVEFTALEDLEDAHVEVTLRDRNSGFVVADSSSTFDLEEDLSTSRTLMFELIDDLKDASSFDLTVKIVDAERHSVQKNYGIVMEGKDATGDIDVSFDRVELEDSVLTEDEMNFVFVGTNRDLDLEVALTSLEDSENARVEAVLTLENGDAIADVTRTFDLNDEDQLNRRLELELPDDFAQGFFKLKVKVIDSEGDFDERIYDLKISQSELPIVIHSIMLNPPSNVQSGKNLIAILRIQNIGTNTLKGVTVQANVPELGLSSSKFIGELDSRQEVFVEMQMKVPQDAQEGQYTMQAEVSKQFSSEKETKEVSFSVQEVALLQSRERLVITLPIVEQEVTEGKESVYPIILKNEGTSSETYTMLISDANWANVRLSDSNMFILKSGETKTINLFVSSKEDIFGEQKLTVSFRNKGNELKQVTLKADIDPAPGINWKEVLKVTMIVIVVLLVLAGALVGLQKYAEESEEDTSSDSGVVQPYY